MSDPFAKTRYRVAQRWQYHCDTPEARDVLVLLGVEDHPALGIVCQVHVDYDPPFHVSEWQVVGLGPFWVTQAALDRSVRELVAEKGPLSRTYGSTGEFRLEPDFWARFPYPPPEGRTVGEVVEEQTERYRRQRDELARNPPPPRPPLAAGGLWTLVRNDQAGRLRELLEQHPDLADRPLPYDETDDYCPNDPAEAEDQYPLMVAAEAGAAQVAEALLAFGAVPHRRDARGDTPLHFTCRAYSRDDGAARVAQMLCDRGADPEARNAAGQTPLTCSHCLRSVAAVLVRHGGRPTLNHALWLRTADWARAELRDNPDAVRKAVAPAEVLGDIGDLIRDEAGRRHGRAVRLARGETPADDEDGGPDRSASWSALSFRLADDEGRADEHLAEWQRMAGCERAAFEEHRDLLDLALARGADPNAGSGLFYAVQMYDTALADWLLAHGADPNREGGTYLSDLAQTRRMRALLRRYGAADNPYAREMDEWEVAEKRLRDELAGRFG